MGRGQGGAGRAGAALKEGKVAVVGGSGGTSLGSESLGPKDKSALGRETANAPQAVYDKKGKLIDYNFTLRFNKGEKKEFDHLVAQGFTTHSELKRARDKYIGHELQKGRRAAEAKGETLTGEQRATIIHRADAAFKSSVLKRAGRSEALASRRSETRNVDFGKRVDKRIKNFNSGRGALSSKGPNGQTRGVRKTIGIKTEASTVKSAHAKAKEAYIKNEVSEAKAKAADKGKKLSAKQISAKKESAGAQFTKKLKTLKEKAQTGNASSRAALDRFTAKHGLKEKYDRGGGHLGARSLKAKIKLAANTENSRVSSRLKTQEKNAQIEHYAAGKHIRDKDERAAFVRSNNKADRRNFGREVVAAGGKARGLAAVRATGGGLKEVKTAAEFRRIDEAKKVAAKAKRATSSTITKIEKNTGASKPTEKASASYNGRKASGEVKAPVAVRPISKRPIPATPAPVVARNTAARESAANTPISSQTQKDLDKLKEMRAANAPKPKAAPKAAKAKPQITRGTKGTPKAERYDKIMANLSRRAEKAGEFAKNEKGNAVGGRNTSRAGKVIDMQAEYRRARG